MKRLATSDLTALEGYLYYFKVSELKEICEKFHLSLSGKKGDLIHRILAFLKFGKKVEMTPLPDISKAVKGTKYPLTPKTLILKGAYKNDLATRKFFKKLIGEHFHFTAFGVDWINERWKEGNPPTYEEFARYWEKETKLRMTQEAKPKKEWAYLNFIQRFLAEHPNAAKPEIGKAWEKERAAMVKKGKAILDGR